ncbi:MAG: hypothetical protein ACRCZQ_02880 [Bacteroidales bacterium]
MKKKVTKDIRMEAQVLGLPLKLFAFWMIAALGGFFIAITPFTLIKFLIIAIVVVVLYIILRMWVNMFGNSSNNDLPPTINNR